jgi:predicted Holliday junction resolvase-like endonuclease
MAFVVVALVVALIALVILLLKNRDVISEQEKRAREFQRAAERAREQQQYREAQHKVELQQLHKQKDGDRQQAESQYKEQIGQILEKESKQQEKVAELQAAINQLAQEQCQAWVQTQCEAIRLEQKEIAKREAEALLEQWKIEREHGIRQDAIRKNHAVNLGKITEHFIPFLPGFNYNPKDARFMGSPVDYIVFDGMDEGEIRKVVFIEVKSGAATLTKRQRQIRDAINGNRCEWKQLGLEEAKKLQEELLFQTAS